ncbi:MAG: rhodanese-like domain-containing protein [Parcubacteria group bacterium]|nr:rhodanese-like domain-containing protein [Parcubacteria group bacterium]
MQTLKIIMIALLVGALSGTLTAKQIMKGFSFTDKQPTETATKSANDLIRDFYDTENAVHISPHSLRKKMDKGDESFILVDLRSGQEYEKEHIIGAINIPAYKDPNTSAYDEVERIVGEFEKLPEGKEIIVYCYSIPCMTGRKIGKMLAGKDIYVKLLGIGWNEWRHFWTLWNHELEWETTKPEDYISSGIEPGKPAKRELPSPCGEGVFAC